MASLRTPSKPRLLGGCLLGLLGLMLALITFRDLPRILAERLLAQSLDARVRITALELSTTGAELRGLSIEAPGIRPEVDRFEIDALHIQGSWRDMLGGRIAFVGMIGSRLFLQPPEKEAPPPSTDLNLGQLEIRDLAVMLPLGKGSSDPPAVLRVQADLQGHLSDLTGRATAKGVFLPFSFLTSWNPSLPPELSGGLQQPELQITIEDEITAELSAHRLQLLVPGSKGAATGAAPTGASLFAAAPTGASLFADSTTPTGASLFADLIVDLAEPRLQATLPRPGGPDSTLEATLETGPAALTLADDAPSFSSPWTRWSLDADLGGPEIRGVLVARWPGMPEARAELEGSLGSGAPTSASLGIRGWSWAETVSGTGTEGELDLDLDWRADRLVARTTVRPVSVHLPEISLEPLEAELRAEGEWSELEPWPVRLTLDLEDASGSMRGRELPATLFPLHLEIDGTGSLGTGSAEGSFSGEVAISNPRLGTITTRGTVTAGPDAESLQPELTWQWRNGDLKALLDLVDSLGEGSAPASLPRARGLLAGQGTLGGSLQAPKVTAELTLADVALELPPAPDARDPIPLRFSRIGTRWRWPGPDGTMELLGLLAEGALPATPPIPESPFQLRARGRIRLGPPSADLTAVQLSLPSLLTATGRLHAAQTADGVRAEGSGTIEGLDLGHWQQILDLPDLGFTAGGAARLVLQDIRLEGKSWKVDAGLDVDELGFTSTDGSRVLEGLTARWNAHAEGLLGGEMQVSARGNNAGFLLLWDTFFADFSSLSATWQVEAEKPSSTEAPWRLRLKGSVPEGPQIDTRVDLRTLGSGPDETSVDNFGLHLEIEDLASFHRRYLEGQDVLGDLLLEGAGTLRLAGVHIGPGSWRVHGALATADLAWSRIGSDMVVQDLDLELPFDLTFVDERVSGPRLQGSIEAGRLGFRQLGLPIPPTELWVEGDALGFEEALSLETFGGIVSFEGLALAELAHPSRHLTGGLRFDGLDLGIITRRLETLPLEGTLDGFLPRFSLDATELRVDGGGTVDIFGGTVEFRGISGSEIFTPFPRLRLAADFRNLDLLQITRRFDFGEMSGLVSGSVRNAELFRGIPVALRARVTTTKRRGMPRSVDVKAVNNLSILGTGGAGLGGNPFDRWFQRFFQRYTYSALGVDIELAEDALLLRGLEKRGERELFLRGRLPFRIDIVNAQPGRTVSFRAMRQRIEQLDFSAATTVP